MTSLKPSGYTAARSCRSLSLPLAAFFIPDTRLPTEVSTLARRENRRRPSERLLDGTPATSDDVRQRRCVCRWARERSNDGPAKASAAAATTTTSERAGDVVERRERGRYDGTGAARNFLDDIGRSGRATGANADAYVSAGATRIRAVGACPSRCLPPCPTASFVRDRSPFAALRTAAVQHPSVPLWPAP